VFFVLSQRQCSPPLFGASYSTNRVSFSHIESYDCLVILAQRRKARVKYMSLTQTLNTHTRLALILNQTAVSTRLLLGVMPTRVFELEGNA